MADLTICIKARAFPAEIPHPFFLPETVPVVLCGPVGILQKRRIAILNSRQSPRFSNSTAWVRNTLAALHSLDSKNTALITSLNTTPWDFLSWAGNRLGFFLVLVFPAGSAQEFALARTKAIIDLDLDERRVLALRPLNIDRRSRAVASALRDKWCLALSQILIPVSIRKGGNLESYLSHPQLSSLKIERRFETSYEAPPRLKKALKIKAIRLPEWYIPSDYLIHWTRSCVGPWPQERRAEYFGRIMQSEHPQFDGIDTLRRIIAEKCIKASKRLVRGSFPVVPFTARFPQDLPELIKWRTGLRRWTFEPYGIAIQRSRLIEFGARAVIYGDENDFQRLSREDRPFFQLARSTNSDWSMEEEWRLPGDVNLNLFRQNEVIILVQYCREKAIFSGLSPYRTIALESAENANH